MASTYSTNLRIELMGTGDKAGSWSLTNNSKLGTLIEEAIVGYTTVPMSDATTTISITDGATASARHFVLELTGALTAARSLEVPAKEKPYLIYNNTTGGFAVVVKVNGQTGVSIPNGKKRFVYNTATDVVDAITDLPTGTTMQGSTILTDDTISIDMTTGVFSSTLRASNFIAGDGSVGVPSMYFVSEPTTGWYRSGTNQQAWSIAGTQQMLLTSSGLGLAGTFTASGLGTFGSLSTASAGITSLAAGTITSTGSIHSGTSVTSETYIAAGTFISANSTISTTSNIQATGGTSTIRALSITTSATVGTSLTVAGTVAADKYTGDNVVPIGGIILWSGSSTMDGWGVTWVLCNGQAISRTTFSALYAKLGTTHGVGDGSTTFNVPNIGAAGAVFYYIYTGL